MRNSIEKILIRNFLLNKFHSNSTTTQPTAKNTNCQKWAPGIHPHKPDNSFLLQYKPHHQVRLNLLFDMVVSEILLCPVLTLLLQFAYTMSPPLFVALFSGSRSIVHWRHCIGTYVKYEICIRYVLISSFIYGSLRNFTAPSSHFVIAICIHHVFLPYMLLWFLGLVTSYTGSTVSEPTWNMKYASGTSWSPLRYGCLGNFTAPSSHFVIANCVHHVPLPYFFALIFVSRGIVCWRHCIGLNIKYEICIRYALISSWIWLSWKFYFCNLRTPYPPPYLL